MQTFEFNNDIEIPAEAELRFEEVAKIIAATSTDVRAIAITSTVDEEGKTFVATNIAKTLAKYDYRVLILMADMRKTIAVDDKVTMGMMDVLDGKTNVENVIYKTDVEGIDVILSGASKENENLVIDRQVYAVMLKCLKEEYNYILVDMPTMGYTDNDEVFLREADMGIMVIQPNAGSKRRLKNNLKIMDVYNCKVLGAVLNNR